MRAAVQARDRRQSSQRRPRTWRNRRQGGGPAPLLRRPACLGEFERLVHMLHRPHTQPPPRQPLHALSPAATPNWPKPWPCSGPRSRRRRRRGWLRLATVLPDLPALTSWRQAAFAHLPIAAPAWRRSSRLHGGGCGW